MRAEFLSILRDWPSILWLALKIAIIIVLMNAHQTFFVYQNF